MQTTQPTGSDRRSRITRELVLLALYSSGYLIGHTLWRPFFW